MNLTVFLERYGREMQSEATSQGMQPIDLDAHTLEVPAAIHQGLWELVTEPTRDSGPTVLAAVQAAVSVADVHATWRAFDTFLPAPLAEPEPPVPPAASPPRAEPARPGPRTTAGSIRPPASHRRHRPDQHPPHPRLTSRPNKPAGTQSQAVPRDIDTGPGCGGRQLVTGIPPVAVSSWWRW